MSVLVRRYLITVHLVFLMLVSGHALSIVPASLELSLAYDREQYALLLDLLSQPSVRSSAEGQYYLGKLHERGLGVKLDMARALVAFEKAGRSGHLEAQARLGLLFETGRSGRKDYQKAFYWTKLAAERGHADSQKNLGVLYESGYGVEVDKSLAIHWFSKAASKGSIKAQRNLGRLLISDTDSVGPMNQGFDWLRLAAHENDSKAQLLLADYCAEYQAMNCKKEALFWYLIASDTFSNANYRKQCKDKAEAIADELDAESLDAVYERYKNWDITKSPNYLVKP